MSELAIADWNGYRMTGQRISHYLLKQEIGRSATGVVYQAEDTRLGRMVAIKIVPESLAADPLVVERFEREARVASGLNHPNVCTIYGCGEDQGRRFIAMELLEGESLREIVRDKPMPAQQAIEIAIPLASALQAAHEQGIIHRDLRSAHIYITRLPSGAVVPKILDFGLAKLLTTAAASANPGGPPILDGSSTVVGLFLRQEFSEESLAYMSPEETEFTPLDARTDLFSFGVILYEMVTGRLPFRGQTLTALFSAIRHEEPAPMTGVPPDLAAVIEKVLRKDRKERYETAADLVAALKRVRRKLQTPEAAPVAKSSSRLWWIVAGAILVLAAALAWFLIAPSARKLSDWKNAGFVQLTDQPDQELFPSLAPDGTAFAYASRAGGRFDVYLQRVGEKTALNLTAAIPGRGNTQPAFAPDGKQVAFRSESGGGGIYLIPASGGQARRVSDFGYNPSWSPDGQKLVVATESVERPEMRPGFGEIWWIDVNSGQKRRITQSDGVQPSWSPHGKRVAYWMQREGQRDLATIPIDGGAPAPVTNDLYMDWNPVWSPDGKYLYFASDRSGSMDIWRVPIDEASGKVTGELERVATPSQDSSHISFSRDGRRMAYVRRAVTQNFRKVAFDPATGTATGQPVAVTEGVRQVMNPDISPDGQSIAFVQWGKNEDIAVMRMDGGGARQLTDDIYKDRGPRWSPDGKRIAFYSNRGGTYQVWLIDANGNGLKQLTNVPKGVLYPVWSPDGKSIAYSVQGDIPAIMEVETSRTEPLPALQRAGGWYEIWSWSPDGKMLAGVERNPDGAYTGEITYDLATRQIQKLTDHGTYPAWVSDNRTLIFPFDDKLYALDRTTRTVRLAFALDRQPVSRLFALSPDSRTLLFGLVVAEADIWMASLP